MNTSIQNTSLVKKHHILIPTILQSIVWLPARIMITLFLKIRIRGIEHIKIAQKLAKKENTGIIFASNHSGELDFVFVGCGITPISKHFPMFYVTRSAKKYNDKGYGWRKYLYSFPFFLSAWGAYAYKAGTGSYANALSFHRSLIENKQNVCVFPEGKFTTDRTTNTYAVHGGVLYLAESTKAPIVPVYIRTLGKITFWKSLLMKNTTQVTYGKPLYAKNIIDPTTSIPERYQDATRKLMDTIYSL